MLFVNLIIKIIRFKLNLIVAFNLKIKYIYVTEIQFRFVVYITLYAI